LIDMMNLTFLPADEREPASADLAEPCDAVRSKVGGPIAEPALD
jgi:hypothetical protein